MRIQFSMFTIRRCLALAPLAFTAPFAAEAQVADDLAKEMQGLVATSLETYRSLEKEIAEEKLPLVARLNELEQANLALRSDVEGYRIVSERASGEAATLGEELRSLQAQSGYVVSTLEDFLVKFESRVHVAETQRYLDRLTALRETVADDATPLARKLQTYADALKLSVERSQQAIGGYSFAGKAVDAQGRIFSGKVVALGPTGYFLDEGSQRAGLLQYSSGTIEPGVTFLDGTEAEDLAGFVSKGTGSVPLDASLGDALSLRETRGDLVSHVRKGGYVGYSILFLGLIAIVLSLLKLRDLSGFSTADPDTLSELVKIAKDKGADAATNRAQSLSGTVRDVLVTGIRNVNKNALLLEETMLSVVLRAKPKMERYLPFLAITAAAAPLLGLLGTVVGLIKTFALITLYGSGAPKALSSGISEALVTTELGLMVAIPALILHGLFSRVIRARIGILEQTTFDFVEAVNLETPEVKR